MRVELLQLVPGCVVIDDVIGKTRYPIIPKKTVLTEEHIIILKKFLIKTVNVSPKLVDGESFIPLEQGEDHEQSLPVEIDLHIKQTFVEYYMDVVTRYQKLFSHWQNNSSIDMTEIRKLLLPLFERMHEIGSGVYTLHNYSEGKEYFYHHSVSVAILSVYLAKKMGYLRKEWIQIGLAGFLSNCGMAKVHPNVLFKKASLTDFEQREIERHPKYSYQLIKPFQTIVPAAKLAVLQHHERLDGSGYPFGLIGEKIHIYARIIAVSDIYQAMTSKRVDKEQQSPFTAIKELQNDQFTKLDPEVVQVLIQNLTSLSGVKVRLSNNQIGKIIFIEEKKPTFPIIRLEESNEILSLEKEPTLYIKEIMNTP